MTVKSEEHQQEEKRFSWSEISVLSISSNPQQRVYNDGDDDIDSLSFTYTNPDVELDSDSDNDNCSLASDDLDCDIDIFTVPPGAPRLDSTPAPLRALQDMSLTEIQQTPADRLRQLLPSPPTLLDANRRAVIDGILMPPPPPPALNRQVCCKVATPPSPSELPLNARDDDVIALPSPPRAPLPAPPVAQSRSAQSPIAMRLPSRPPLPPSFGRMTLQEAQRRARQIADRLDVMMETSDEDLLL